MQFYLNLQLMNISFCKKKDSYAYLFKCKYRNMAFLVSNIDWALSYIFEVFLAHSCQFRYLYYL